ncbi:unnamed protein product [Moneuplotes crassus]|uniref:Uncharacterized protein n=1 Tax=Euplotes crassus TaxID=5936 RepID=A0AAD1XF67_EUPCR|nr:unnamed protein product [Moneuplotes crassus]
MEEQKYTLGPLKMKVTQAKRTKNYKRCDNISSINLLLCSENRKSVANLKQASSIKKSGERKSSKYSQIKKSKRRSYSHSSSRTVSITSRSTYQTRNCYKVLEGSKTILANKYYKLSGNHLKPKKSRPGICALSKTSTMPVAVDLSNSEETSLSKRTSQAHEAPISISNTVKEINEIKRNKMKKIINKMKGACRKQKCVKNNYTRNNAPGLDRKWSSPSKIPLKSNLEISHKKKPLVDTLDQTIGQDLQKHELLQKLEKARREIEQIKLEFQKERNLREMHICKLCATSKMPDAKNCSIGAYIHKNLQEIKNST